MWGSVVCVECVGLGGGLGLLERLGAEVERVFGPAGEKARAMALAGEAGGC